MKELILIGMPGCGKSSLGKILAERLNRPFLDLDAEIEKASGKTINEIFQEAGEAGFRNIETEIFRKTIGFGGVLATGGGIVTMPENKEIAQQGVVVFLDRPLPMIQDTITTEERPLLKNGKERLAKLYAERYDKYLEWADIIISNQGTMEETIEKMMKEVECYENYGD